MSLANLVHTRKCPNCDNQVPVGRLVPKIPRMCDQCKREKKKIYARDLARKKLRIRVCVLCNERVDFEAKGKTCTNCKQKIIQRYHTPRPCLYCGKEIIDGKLYCNREHMLRVLHVVKYNNKRLDEVLKDVD